MSLTVTFLAHTGDLAAADSGAQRSSQDNRMFTWVRIGPVTIMTADGTDPRDLVRALQRVTDKMSLELDKEPGR